MESSSSNNVSGQVDCRFVDPAKKNGKCLKKFAESLHILGFSPVLAIFSKLKNCLEICDPILTTILKIFCQGAKKIAQTPGNKAGFFLYSKSNLLLIFQ